MKIMTEKGFTLLEVLLAMTLLSIGILGIAGLAGTAVRSSGYSQALTQASNLAQEKMEALISVDFSNLQSSDSTTARTDLRRTCTQTDTTVSRPVYSCSPTTAAVVIGSQTYTWGYTVTYIDLDSSGTASSSDGLKRIDLTVSWTDPLWHTTKSLTAVTLRTRG
ncbi:MAG: prepilin-type N-terminal cleavage/methylation domain-containing protein [Deltaproteobacteria bacterium]|nr:prepilin-type N-terminal cleavage/methylation domain-containing protein [Deltaproteobacteria bacterium]